MDKAVSNRVKDSLTVIGSTSRLAKKMLANAETHTRVACYVSHIKLHCEEILKVITPQPNEDTHQVVLDLDGETLSVGKVATISNEKEEKEEEKDKS